MIPFRYRFHGHASLKYVYQHGKTFRTKNFNVRYISNSHRRNSRVAIVVSKKISKKAVKRNLIRRRFYNIIYPLISYFNNNYDLVFIINNKDIADLSFADLEQKIKESLKRAKIMVK